MLPRLSLLIVLSACTVGAQSPAVQPANSCRARSDLVGKCFTVHGRLSVYNGTPSIRLWPIGTKRLLGVIDPRDPSAVPGRDTLPESIASKLDFDKDVFGDFLVCPLTRSKPGRMQTVCIESGKSLVVRLHK
jgi:hypothetical protein